MATPTTGVNASHRHAFLRLLAIACLLFSLAIGFLPLGAAHDSIGNDENKPLLGVHTGKPKVGIEKSSGDLDSYQKQEGGLDKPTNWNKLSKSRWRLIEKCYNDLLNFEASDSRDLKACRALHKQMRRESEKGTSKEEGCPLKSDKYEMRSLFPQGITDFVRQVTRCIGAILTVDRDLYKDNRCCDFVPFFTFCKKDK